MNTSSNSGNSHKRNTRNSNKTLVVSTNSDNPVVSNNTPVVSKKSDLAKNPVMPSKSSVGSEKFEESALRTDPLVRSNLQVQNVSESVVTPSHQKRAMTPVSSLETLQGKEDGRLRLDIFPRTSATSTTTTTLQPTLNAPEKSLQGGNRVFSAAKIYQRGEETGFSKSSSNSRENLTNSPVDIKVESSPRGSKSVNSQRGSLETRATTRHKPSITSVF